jgi:hypothetical protein
LREEFILYYLQQFLDLEDASSVDSCSYLSALDRGRLSGSQDCIDDPA